MKYAILVDVQSQGDISQAEVLQRLNEAVTSLPLSLGLVVEELSAIEEPLIGAADPSNPPRTPGQSGVNSRPKN